MSEGETDRIRAISGELDALPGEARKFISGYAYVLARVARTDPGFSDAERETMERAVIEVGQLSEPQAVLVVQVARSLGLLYGATEDYVVTREFARIASREQREALLRTGFVVSAADDNVSGPEIAELNEIGVELGLSPDDVDVIRRESLERLGAPSGDRSEA
jgi:tellurite resistance protein